MGKYNKYGDTDRVAQIDRSEEHGTSVRLAIFEIQLFSAAIERESVYIAVSHL